MWHKYLTHVLITSVCYFHPVCVQILDQLISSMHVCHRYLGIYENIAFFVNILDNLIQVVILLGYYYHPICIPIRVFTQMKTSMPSPRWWKRGFYSSKKSTQRWGAFNQADPQQFPYQLVLSCITSAPTYLGLTCTSVCTCQ